MEFSENDFEDLIQKINSGIKIDCRDCDTLYSTKNFKYRFEIENEIVTEIITQKIQSDSDSVNDVNPPSESSFPYEQTEIVDFLARYYQMINSGNIDNYETFFEPIIDMFYRIPNMNSNLAKVDFEDNNLKNGHILFVFFMYVPKSLSTPKTRFVHSRSKV